MPPSAFGVSRAIHAVHPRANPRVLPLDAGRRLFLSFSSRQSTRAPSSRAGFVPACIGTFGGRLAVNCDPVSTGIAAGAA
jgi:hypothetical protein